MSVAIILDDILTPFTSLDTISGKVQVRTPKAISISSIVVKLEGESRTRLTAPRTLEDDRPRPQIELHKILYKTDMVFPPLELRGHFEGGNPPELQAHLEQKKPMHVRRQADDKHNFTLPPGQHEYRFSFKLPANLSCATDPPAESTFSMGGLNIAKVSLAHGGVVRVPEQHIQGPLPPTLRRLPGEADIRYFIKATVARPSFISQNIRSEIDFSFCPRDPPMAPDNGSETYARRTHTFQGPALDLGPGTGAATVTGSSLKQKLSRFGSSANEKKAGITSVAPVIHVETRIPESAIIMLNQDLPLKIFVKSLNEKIDGLFLQSLQLDLACYTHIRAFGLKRVEQGGLVLLSNSNLSIPLAFESETGEADIPRSLWQNVPLPGNVPPTFMCCNISRNYDLIVRIGIRWDVARDKPQYGHFELHNPVRVHSGLSADMQARRPTSAAPDLPMHSHPSHSLHAPALPPRRESTTVSPPHSEKTGAVPGAWPAKPNRDAKGQAVPLHPSPAPDPSHGPGMQTVPTPGVEFAGVYGAQQHGVAASGTGGGGGGHHGEGPAGAQGQEEYADAPPSYEDAVAGPAQRQGHDTGTSSRPAGYQPPSVEDGNIRPIGKR